MCAHYTVFTEEELLEMRAIIAEVSRKFGDGAVSTGSIFPTNIAPVLTRDGNRLAPRPASWGFPKWDGKGVIFNARSETALEKPMFRTSLLRRRCVIPSTGYYEWQSVAGQKKKDKYLIRLPGSGMVYMAGLLNTFRGADGNPYTAYTILTTAASGSAATIHDRMPVILMQSQLDRWVADDTFTGTVLSQSGPEVTPERAVAPPIKMSGQ